MVLRNQFKVADAFLQESLQRSITELGYNNVSDFAIPPRGVTAENSADLKSNVEQLNKIWLKQFKIIKPYRVKDFNDYCYTMSGNNELGWAYCPFKSGQYHISISAYQLSNGIIVTPLIMQGGVASVNHPAQLSFAFDTNGLKGPNRCGYDIFKYYAWVSYNSEYCKDPDSPWQPCYYYATRNKNPVYNDKEYWDILYKPKSYFEKK